MSQFYNDNEELNIYYPVNTPITYNLEEDFENIQTIMPLIENQIKNLTDLFHTYEFNVYSPFLNIFISDQLEYINDNYIMIHNFDSIIDNDIQSRIIFMYLYELLVVDLVQEIIPEILNRNLDLELQDLILLDNDILKRYLFNVIESKVENFNKIKSTIKNNSNHEITPFEYKSLKYTFYLDLFDSDLDNFKENVIQPLIIKYKDEIEAFT